MDTIATDYKKIILATLVRELENITHDEKKLLFLVRDVNTPANAQIIKKHYTFLKKHYDLPRENRQPQKIVSQTLRTMVQGCCYSFKKSTKCYYVQGMKTTSGFYECECV